MTAKESKAVAWRYPDARGRFVFTHGNIAPYPDAEPLIPESALHAAEAELGELRRRFSDLELAALALADAVQEETDYLAGTPARALSGVEMTTHDNRVMELTRNLHRTLASDGGADGDNEVEK